MARRFNRYLHPVNTKKHVIDQQGGLVVATQQSIGLVKGVDAPTLGVTNSCAVGSTVKSIFLNVQVYATSTAALANCYLIVYKNPGNNIATFPNANVTGSSDTKKLIFHTEMVMLEKNTTGLPRNLFKGVLRIPRHMQRVGQDDVIAIQLFSPGVTVDFCVECIYKEIR